MGIKDFFKVFNNATKLDIFDLVYEFSSEKLNTLSVFPIKRKGIFKRSLIYLWHLLGSMGSLWKNESRIISNSIVFFVCSKNERDAIYPIYKKIEGSYLIDTASISCFKIFWAYVIGLFFSPIVYAKYLKATGYYRKSMTYLFDHYLISYGLYIYARIWMQFALPKVLILSNHTNTINRVMLTVAKEMNIKTIYVQHASVNDNFPPLTFDYALLEGMDSLNKYARCGYTKTKAFLVGMPKFDSHFCYTNKNDNIQSIGICLNALDSFDRFVEICREVRNEYPIVEIIIRPYGIERKYSDWQYLENEYNLAFSDFNNEKSFDFLKKVDAVIAGDSNILLEATLMNVFPIYYDFSKQNLDWYGFIKNGLVKYSSEPQEVCHILTLLTVIRPSVREKAKRYCHTVHTAYDGHSTELACELINYINSTEHYHYEKWNRIRNVDMEAYEYYLPEIINDP